MVEDTKKPNYGSLPVVPFVLTSSRFGSNFTCHNTLLSRQKLDFTNEILTSEGT